MDIIFNIFDLPKCRKVYQIYSLIVLFIRGCFFFKAMESCNNMHNILALFAQYHLRILPQFPITKHIWNGIYHLMHMYFKRSKCMKKIHCAQVIGINLLLCKADKTPDKYCHFITRGQKHPIWKPPRKNSTFYWLSVFYFR